jgi:nucleotide-binding universal stress UspA family protein
MNSQLQKNTGEKGYNKILVATDGSPFGEAAVKAAADRVWPKEALLRVVTVAETPVFHGSVMLLSRLADMESSAIQEIASKAAEELKQGSENVSTIVRKGSPADEIIKEAKDWEADLIILGTHGRSGKDLFLLGSVAERVAAYAPCSVEIVRRN